MVEQSSEAEDDQHTQVCELEIENMCSRPENNYRTFCQCTGFSTFVMTQHFNEILWKYKY